MYICSFARNCVDQIWDEESVNAKPDLPGGMAYSHLSCEYAKNTDGSKGILWLPVLNSLHGQDIAVEGDVQQCQTRRMPCLRCRINQAAIEMKSDSKGILLDLF